MTTKPNNNDSRKELRDFYNLIKPETVKINDNHTFFKSAKLLFYTTTIFCLLTVLLSHKQDFSKYYEINQKSVHQFFHPDVKDFD